VSDVKNNGGNATSFGLFGVTLTMIIGLGGLLFLGVAGVQNNVDDRIESIISILKAEREDRIAGDLANETASDKRHATAIRDLDKAMSALSGNQRLSRAEVQEQLRRIEEIIDVISKEAFRGLGRNNINGVKYE